MKTFNHIIITALVLICGSMYAQTINWGNLNTEDRHIFGANAGLDFGAVYGVGYGYHVKSNLVPFTVNIEFTTAAGESFLDDFKAKPGVKIEWVDVHHFKFTTDLLGVFRRYENNFVRLLDFGCDLSGGIGYYRNRWFISGEIGFDKAIITHFKHSDLYNELYPYVEDGWYGPATGGNFYYGFRAGVSFGKSDVTMKAGRTITQDFRTTPTIPYYGQLGYAVRI